MKTTIIRNDPWLGECFQTLTVYGIFRSKSIGRSIAMSGIKYTKIYN